VSGWKATLFKNLLLSKPRTFMMAILLPVVIVSMAIAYDSMVVDRLERSRDALLDQKTQLEESDQRLGETIDELNRKRDRVQTYLRDTDKALMEVELALRGK
jgi:uncharacterized protein YlxW (UPF0749 family)